MLRLISIERLSDGEALPVGDSDYSKPKIVTLVHHAWPPRIHVINKPMATVTMLPLRSLLEWKDSRQRYQYLVYLLYPVSHCHVIIHPVIVIFPGSTYYLSKPCTLLPSISITFNTPISCTQGTACGYLKCLAMVVHMPVMWLVGAYNFFLYFIFSLL